MAIGINNNYYGAASSILNRTGAAESSSSYNDWYSKLYGSSSESSSNQVFDYKAAQEQVKQAMEDYKTQSTQTSTLKKDSAQFLSDYSKQMTLMESSTKDLKGANLNKLIGTVSEGKVSDEGMKKLTNSMEKMVDSYNSTLKNLNKNADRGSGVVRQIGRMAQAPAAEASMKMVGVTVNKDGTLALDKDKLKEVVTAAAAADEKVGDTGRMDLLKDIIGGSNGIAAGVQKDAKSGINSPAASLIGNDLANIQNERMMNPLNLSSMYSRSGAYNMMNMGAVGLLMNVMA